MDDGSGIWLSVIGGVEHQLCLSGYRVFRSGVNVAYPFDALQLRLLGALMVASAIGANL